MIMEEGKHYLGRFFRDLGYSGGRDEAFVPLSGVTYPLRARSGRHGRNRLAHSTGKGAHGVTPTGVKFETDGEVRHVSAGGS